MRFLTAVALAAVMLWVPVDGVAQSGIRLVGDWAIEQSEDPFTDEKNSKISLSAFDERRIKALNIDCDGNEAVLSVFTEPLVGSDTWTGPNPDRVKEVTLTYRLGDDPAITVTAPIVSTAPWYLVFHGLESSEISALISSPRIAVKVQGVRRTIQTNWADLEGTTEAVRSLHCVR
jgi:hypothetical protein